MEKKLGQLLQRRFLSTVLNGLAASVLTGGNYAGGNKRRPATCNQRAIRRSRGGENNNNDNIDSIESILLIMIIAMRMIIHDEDGNT